MITEQLQRVLADRGCHTVGVNIPDISVDYVAQDKEAFVVARFDFTGELQGRLSGEQYRHICAQLKTAFHARGFAQVHLLSLFLTEAPDSLKTRLGAALPEEQYGTDSTEDYWLLDVAQGRLMIYEDQCGEFLGLRAPLERLLFAAQAERQRGWAAANEQREPRQTRRFSEAARSPVWKGLSCNLVLVILNTLIFLIVDLGPERISVATQENGVLFWPAVLEGHEYYRLLTYQFLHGGIDHLANNMLLLFFVGSMLETAIGKLRYLLIYFGTGLAAGIASVLYYRSEGLYASSIGASGAVFGLIGAMAVLLLLNRKRLPHMSKGRIAIFIFLSLYGGFINEGVDNAAHLGGLAAGVVLMLLLLLVSAARQSRKKGRKSE